MNRNYKYCVAVLFVCACAAAVAKEQPLPPVAPSHVHVEALSDSSVGIRWYDNSGNELGFAVQRSVDGRNWRQIGTVTADKDRFQDVGLDAATCYKYRVAAFNRSGRSDFSSVAEVQTMRLAGGFSFLPYQGR